MKLPRLLSVARVLTVFVCIPAVGLGESSASESERLGLDIDEYLTAIVPFGFNGAVLIAKDGQIVLNGGYGLANLVNATPIKPDTVFDIGSITKVFTATAVLILEMQGSLSTEDSLDRFFADLPEDKSGITVHQLLTHSAGLRSGFGADYESVNRDELVHRFRDTDLENDPGESFSYSNAGYSLLAAVIETVAEQTWESFIKEQFLQPIGVERTGYLLPGIKKNEVAHLRMTESSYPNPLSRPGPYWNLIGNGGLLSTTFDLYQFMKSLNDNSILSIEARTKMIAPQVAWNGREGVHYGYGLEIAPTARGTTVLGHSGGSGEGVNAVVKWFVDESVVLILLSNDFIYSMPAIFGIPQVLERAMFGEPLPQVPAVGAVAQVEPYVGRYRLKNGPAFELSCAGNGLGLTLVEEEDTEKWDSATLPLPKTHLRLFAPASPDGGYVFYDPLLDTTSRMRFEMSPEGAPNLVIENGQTRVVLRTEPVQVDGT